MDFQLLRSLGVANYMGAAVGEIFAALQNIKEGDPRSWPPVFAALGDQTQAIARSVLPKHRVIITALVANSPIPDLHAYVAGFVGHEVATNPPPLRLEEGRVGKGAVTKRGIRKNVKRSAVPT